MANYENIKDKGFDKRPKDEVRALAHKGGVKSGEVRRRKADFKKTLNVLLTTPVPVENEQTEMIRQLGLDCTLETAMLMTQILAATQGDTTAARFVAEYAGQSKKDAADEKKIEADIELTKARKRAVAGEDENDEAIERLDEILKEIRDNAVKQEAERVHSECDSQMEY